MLPRRGRQSPNPRHQAWRRQNHRVCPPRMQGGPKEGNGEDEIGISAPEIQAACRQRAWSKQRARAKAATDAKGSSGGPLHPILPWRPWRSWRETIRREACGLAPRTPRKNGSPRRQWQPFGSEPSQPAPHFFAPRRAAPAPHTSVGVETPPMKRLSRIFVFQNGDGGVLLSICHPEYRCTPSDQKRTAQPSESTGRGAS